MFYIYSLTVSYVSFFMFSVLASALMIVSSCSTVNLKLTLICIEVFEQSTRQQLLKGVLQVYILLARCCKQCLVTISFQREKNVLKVCLRYPIPYETRTIEFHQTMKTRHTSQKRFSSNANILENTSSGESKNVKVTSSPIGMNQFLWQCFCLLLFRAVLSQICYNVHCGTFQQVNRFSNGYFIYYGFSTLV